MAPIPLRLISLRLASSLSILCTFFYVSVLYLLPSARPTKTISKDSPRVIKSRIFLVTCASIASALVTVSIGKTTNDTWLSSATRVLGLPFKGSQVVSSLLLTATLFSGPLYERLIVDRDFLSLYPITSWVGFRNLIAGPISEEFVFRSCIVPLHLFAGQSIGKIVLVTPLYFGLAHIHHIYERNLSHPGHMLQACVISLVQFTYTTIFGWFAAFLFIRTGSIWSSIFVHSFCNSMGLPRVTGRLPGSIIHTLMYYTLLVLGALLFALNIETSTQSGQAYQPYSFI